MSSKNIASYQNFSKIDNNINNELRTGKNCHKAQEDLSFVNRVVLKIHKITNFPPKLTHRVH